MNYKAFTFIFFVLIFCLSSTTSSRRLLSGSGGNKMEMQPHHPRSAGSATQQSPPERHHIAYAATHNRTPVCNEKIYGNCISSPPKVRRCNYGRECRGN